MKNKIFLIVIILIGLVSNIFPQTLFRSGIFLHHSTGGVIWNSSNPDVPQLMNMYNTENNYTGNNAVTMNIGESFFPSINNGGNFYDTWHAVFVGESDYPEEDLALQQYIQNNHIVVIKSCWGGSSIAPMGNPADTLVIDDEAVGSGGRTYYRTQWHWRNIIRVMRQHPETFFVIWTGIPLVPGPSYDGTIAHNFFTWAKNTLALPPNVYVFDAFHLLATPTENFSWGTAYWGMNPLYHDAGDNHPNVTGANAVAHPFVWETFDASINYETGGETFQLSLPVQNVWNMVSIPGLHPLNQDVSTWWINRDPLTDVFSYNGSYHSVTTVTPGAGYWMKHSGVQTYNTGDEWPSSGIYIVAHNPINGNAGWNLIGGYESIVATSGITTTPPGLQTGPVYSYSSIAGYQVADNLVPGFGYLIKLTGTGSINITSTLSKSSAISTEYITEDWGKIIITDNAGKHYILYGVKREVNLDDYELPPAPPAGMFDVRYESGRFTENLNGCIKTIEMNGIEYPVTVKVENMSIKIQDESGEIVNESLKTGEEVIINSSLSKLLVSGVELSEKFSLEQNYPNPFNPATAIRFNLPKAGDVKLTIYDIIGQEVRTLVNEFKESGVYTINFEAGELNSGIYIYKLESNGFIQTRKMILLK